MPSGRSGEQAGFDRVARREVEHIAGADRLLWSVTLDRELAEAVAGADESAAAEGGDHAAGMSKGS